MNEVKTAMERIFYEAVKKCREEAIMPSRVPCFPSFVAVRGTDGTAAFLIENIFHEDSRVWAAVCGFLKQKNGKELLIWRAQWNPQGGAFIHTMDSIHFTPRPILTQAHFLDPCHPRGLARVGPFSDPVELVDPGFGPIISYLNR
jgi:hypothetical protein